MGDTKILKACANASQLVSRLEELFGETLVFTDSSALSAITMNTDTGSWSHLTSELNGRLLCMQDYGNYAENIAASSLNGVLDTYDEKQTGEALANNDFCLDADTFKQHAFAIRAETPVLELLSQNSSLLTLYTSPDHSNYTLTRRFPNSEQACLEDYGDELALNLPSRSAGSKRTNGAQR